VPEQVARGGQAKVSKRTTHLRSHAGERLNRS